MLGPMLSQLFSGGGGGGAQHPTGGNPFENILGHGGFPQMPGGALFGGQGQGSGQPGQVHSQMGGYDGGGGQGNPMFGGQGMFGASPYMMGLYGRMQGSPQQQGFYGQTLGTTMNPNSGAGSMSSQDFLGGGAGLQQSPGLGSLQQKIK